jgi:hypothetical protein
VLDLVDPARPLRQHDAIATLPARTTGRLRSDHRTGKLATMDFRRGTSLSRRDRSKRVCHGRACGCQAAHAEYRAHRRGHPCPCGMARRTAPARRGTLAACRRGQDRADTLTGQPGAFTLASTLSRQPGRPFRGQQEFFGAGAEGGVPRLVFTCVPSPFAQTRTEQVHCYPICYPTVWDKRGLKQTKNAKVPENFQQIGMLSDLEGRCATAATELETGALAIELHS